MTFRVLFWNIEDFAGGKARTESVVGHIRATDPDVVGICEVRDKTELRKVIGGHFKDFDFAITDGDQEVELAVGWRRGLFDQTLFTQRREFKTDNPDLRPGALLSVQRNGGTYNILFLHADSGRKIKDYSNRLQVFDHVWSLKASLDRIDGGDAKLIVMGDFNTMGHDATNDHGALHGNKEIRALDRAANKRGMNLLSKSDDNSFLQVHDGEIKFAADLDHALISRSVSLAKTEKGARVMVRGWVDGKTEQEQIDFVEGLSDHASIEVIVE